MDTRSTPGWIFRYHAKDQLASLFIYSLSTGSCSPLRQELPIQPESCTVPTNNGRGRHDQQAILPASPKSLDRNPKEPIERVEPRAFVLALQDRKLLAQCQIFEQ